MKPEGWAWGDEIGKQHRSSVGRERQAADDETEAADARTVASSMQQPESAIV